jgi:hypothetical protein
VRRAAAAVLALALLAGCGAPSADLFVVTRSGKDKNANVSLLVSDDGTVRCNKGKPREMGAKRLLAARELTRDLEKQAALGLELPRGPGSILSYKVRMEAGTIAFSDTSRGRPQTFNRLAAFSADTIEHVCKITRG